MTCMRIAARVLVAAAITAQPAAAVAQTLSGAEARGRLANQTPVLPAFRAGVVLVPVDVRVIDSNGFPVSNLTAGDFTLFENGVRQRIAQFSTQAFRAGATPAPPPRFFFFVLGRGGLSGTSQAVDALSAFVRTRLLPGDRVGVLVYLHLVEPTTDHAAVVRLLERYRAQHHGIEDKLARDAQRGTDAAVWELAPDTQLAIDALFAAPALPSARHVPAGSGDREIDFPDGPSLVRSLEYLRHIEGEKQLVLLTERGFPNAGWYASGAAAARVSVSTIPTGDLRIIWTPSSPFVGSLELAPGPGAALSADPLRILAEQTGGQAFSQNATIAFERLARAMSFQYLLGFHPEKPPLDGEYRDLRVTLNRRSLKILYRHAYEAQSRSAAPGGRDGVR